MKQKKRWLLPINFPLKHKRFGKAAATWCLRLAQFLGKYEKQFQRWSVSSGRTWEVVLNRLIEKLIVDCQWLGRSDNGLFNQFDLREKFCFFFLGDLFWKSRFWGGGKIPTIGVGQMGRRLKLWSVFDKVQTLGTRHSTCEMIQTLPQVGIVEC